MYNTMYVSLIFLGRIAPPHHPKPPETRILCVIVELIIKLKLTPCTSKLILLHCQHKAIMKLIIFFLSYASLWHSIHGQEYESTSFRLRGSDEELAAKAGQTTPVRRLIESMYMSAPILEAEISMSATPIIEAARSLIGD
jgi:hypothetical protein